MKYGVSEFQTQGCCVAVDSWFCIVGQCEDTKWLIPIINTFGLACTPISTILVVISTKIPVNVMLLIIHN